VLNLSTRIGASSKLSLNNTYTRGAENEASHLVGFNEEFSSNFDITRLLFVERSVQSHQLAGEHRVGGRGTLSWGSSYSRVTRDEPDRSDLVYLADRNEWWAAPRSATRTFSDLSEDAWETSADYRILLGKLSNPGTFKFGAFYRHTDRDANSRAYDIINIGLNAAGRQGSPEDVLSDANASAGNFTAFANQNAGFYQASERIVAGFGQFEVPLGARIRLIAGARVERWELNVLSRGVTGGLSPARPRNTDLLPSLAFNFRVTDDHAIRLSATQTVSRPEYRELSDVPYFEQVGLLITQGNPALKRAKIQNFDARWEWFPSAGEVFSAGVFAKRFNDPIEKVIILGTGTNILSFVNADEATNYGVELELRKSLGVLGAALAPFTAFTNTTLMTSDITPGNTGVSALTNTNRPMVGQSEYVVNAGVGYAHPRGAFEATVLYNVTGRRILEAGTASLPDAYEEARQLLDASLRLNVSSRLSFKIDAKNILDSPFELTQGAVARQRYHLGRTFGVAASWRP
jgi:TonB-dependent receptor